MKKIILGIVFVLGTISMKGTESYQLCLQEAWEHGTEYGWNDETRYYYTLVYANSCDRGLEDGLYK